VGFDQMSAGFYCHCHIVRLSGQHAVKLWMQTQITQRDLEKKLNGMRELQRKRQNFQVRCIAT